MRRRLGLLLVVVMVLAVSAKSSATLASRLKETRSGGPQASTAYMPPLAGQTPGAKAPRLSVGVDGAVNPELIPDELAYDHFLRAMATSTTSAGRQVALTRAGLAQSDRAAFVTALETLGQELSAMAAERRAGGPSRHASAHDQLKLREEMAVTGARLRVAVALSPVGRAQLDAHIRSHVKRHIKIYRGPMVPGAGGHH